MNYAEYKKESFHEVVSVVNEIIKEEGLKSKDSKHCLSNKRHYLAWFVKENAGISFREIGLMFDRDHSSILGSYRKHVNMIEYKDSRYITNIKIVHRFLLERFPNAINVELD